MRKLLPWRIGLAAVLALNRQPASGVDVFEDLPAWKVLRENVVCARRVLF